jgi:hypothetical protein
MSISIPDNDHLMVSYVDQRVAIDAVARLVHDDPAADQGFSLFPFDAVRSDTPVRIIAYSVPPALL